MGQFSQFGLNVLKWGQTHFSHFPIYLDPDKLDSCNLVCSSMRWFAKVNLDLNHFKMDMPETKDGLVSV